MTTCELPRQIAAQAFQRVRTPALLKRRGCFFVGLTMRVPNKNEGQCLAESESLAETQPSLRHAFRHVYGFILQAVKGDKAAADAIFEDYLAGKFIRKTAVNFAPLRERGPSRLIQARDR